MFLAQLEWLDKDFLTLLENHPWFKVIDIAASEKSKDKTYREAVSDRWLLEQMDLEFVKNNS